MLFFIATYALTNLGAFGVIALLGTRGRANDDLRDYAGLFKSHPALAVLMTFGCAVYLVMIRDYTYEHIADLTGARVTYT